MNWRESCLKLFAHTKHLLSRIKVTIFLFPNFNCLDISSKPRVFHKFICKYAGIITITLQSICISSCLPVLFNTAYQLHLHNFLFSELILHLSSSSVMQNILIWKLIEYCYVLWINFSKHRLSFLVIFLPMNHNKDKELAFFSFHCWKYIQCFFCY